jgi:plasmid stabilization system protein ParE
MKTKIEITPEAEQDITSIITNIQLQHPSIARQTLLEIKNQFQLLASQPDIGRVGGSDGTREIVLRGLPYIAIYEHTQSIVTIVRVLAGAGDASQNV